MSVDPTAETNILPRAPPWWGRKLKGGSAMTHVRITIMSALIAVIATAAGCGESSEVRELSTKVGDHEERLAKLEGLAKQAAARRASVATADPASTAAPVECTVELAKSHDPEGVARHEKNVADRQTAQAAERTRYEALEKQARGFAAEPRGLLAVPYVSVPFYTQTCELGARQKRDDASRCELTSSCTDDSQSPPVARISFPGWRGLLVLVADAFREDASGTYGFNPGHFPQSFLPIAVAWDVAGTVRPVLVGAIEGEAFPALARWATPLVVPLIPEEHKAAAQQALLKYWAASSANMPDAEASATANSSWATANEENQLQGLFLRRWMNAGRAAAGDRVITNLRRAMADAARALGMPQATEWSRAVTYHSRPVTVAAATARPDAGATTR